MGTLAIHNGLVIDPREKTAKYMNVLLENGRIAAFSDQPMRADQVLDAKGHIVCPGFIDVHGHVDGITMNKDLKRCAELSLLEGVTTMISGNCGGSVTDVGEFLREMDKGFPFHHAELIGGSALRRAVGHTDIFTPAGKKEIEKMCALAEKAMQDGAAGISFGLGYTPGTSVEETDALGRIAKKYNRIVTVDTGLEDDFDLDSLEEAFDIARHTGVRLLISHLVYQYGEEVMTEALEMLKKAREDGLDVWADSGMYVDWATGIGSECYRESYVYAHENILPNLLAATGEHAGQRLNEELYRHLRAEHPRETVICITGANESIYKAYTPEQDYIMPSSDTAPYDPGEGHPQIAGTFPAFFRMVRERKNIDLIDAVYRATYLPAQVMKMPGKGRMEIGADADLVIFDPKNIRDMAAMVDVGKPDAAPEGVDAVLVAGEIAARNGKILRSDLGKGIRIK